MKNDDEKTLPQHFGELPASPWREFIEESGLGQSQWQQAIREAGLDEASKLATAFSENSSEQIPLSPAKRPRGRPRKFTDAECLAAEEARTHPANATGKNRACARKLLGVNHPSQSEIKNAVRTVQARVQKLDREGRKTLPSSGE